MAHANYECCVVCDDEVYYSTDAEAKEVLCARCAAELATRGVVVHGPSEFIEWVKTADPDFVRNVLLEVGFRPCYYSSVIDRIVNERIFPDISSEQFRSREYWDYLYRTLHQTQEKE